jgi:hypothetical protein
MTNEDCSPEPEDVGFNLDDVLAAEREAAAGDYMIAHEFFAELRAKITETGSV